MNFSITHYAKEHYTKILILLYHNYSMIFYIDDIGIIRLTYMRYSSIMCS